MRNRRTAEVRWTGRDLLFEGRTGDAPPLIFDPQSREGPSPTETVLMALAACMAIDIRAILEKSRVPLTDLVVEVEGDRVPDPPRRYEAIRMVIRAKGPAESDLPKLERAAQLSRDKYCSVFHTLRSDINVEITTVLG